MSDGFRLPLNAGTEKGFCHWKKGCGFRFPCLNEVAGFCPGARGGFLEALCVARGTSVLSLPFLLGSALFSGPMPTPLNSACFRLPHHSAMREGVYTLSKPMKYRVPISNHEGFYPCARDRLSKLVYRPWSDWCVNEIGCSFFCNGLGILFAA